MYSSKDYETNTNNETVSNIKDESNGNNGNGNGNTGTVEGMRCPYAMFISQLYAFVSGNIDSSRLSSYCKRL